MSDFVSQYWSVSIIAITIVSIVACAVLLKMTTQKTKGAKVETTGHKWDEDLAEYNNPLPSWWRGLFYVTIVFGLGYLVLYPGLGSFGGVFGWSSAQEYATERDKADQETALLYAGYLQQDIKLVAADASARAMGQRLFLNYCAQCHGSDAGGSKGFPSLRDDDWLHGEGHDETPEDIKKAITDGFNAVMPAFGPALGDEGVKNVMHYVRSLSGLVHDEGKAAFGKANFATLCAACHGPEGKGNRALGAPDLTDKVWLYGSSEATIVETVSKGRNNQMPAHGPILGEGKVHVLAAYVWGLSHPDLARSGAAAK